MPSVAGYISQNKRESGLTDSRSGNASFKLSRRSRKLGAALLSWRLGPQAFAQDTTGTGFETTFFKNSRPPGTKRREGSSDCSPVDAVYGAAG